MQVELTDRAQRVLQRLQPGSDLASSIEAVTLDALRMRLRVVADQLGSMEARYGRGFEQFAADWSADRVSDRVSPRGARGVVVWGALPMERQGRLDLIRELAAPFDAAF